MICSSVDVKKQPTFFLQNFVGLKKEPIFATLFEIP
jgi:hypothetical protein